MSEGPVPVVIRRSAPTGGHRSGSADRQSNGYNEGMTKTRTIGPCPGCGRSDAKVTRYDVERRVGNRHAGEQGDGSASTQATTATCREPTCVWYDAGYR